MANVLEWNGLGTIWLNTYAWLGGLEVTRTLRFRFDLNRAIQAAGVVLRDRGPMDRIRLMKILYIASRTAIEKTGKPIIGGRLSALDDGPLHSDVYSQIKGDANDLEWRKFFQNSGHTVSLKTDCDPGRLDLSPFEIDELNIAADWAEKFETFELSRETHKFPEWKNNEPAPGSSKPIPVEDVLDALGITGEDAQEIIWEQKSHDAFIASLDDGK